MGRFDLRLGALLTLSSCIIYTTELVEDDVETEVEAPETEPPPVPTDLTLDVDEAEVGATIRTVLETDEPQGLEGLQVVRFERNVTVVDAVIDSRRADLIVTVDDDAALGDVDVTVQFTLGRTARLIDGFTILPASGSVDTSSDSGTLLDTATTTLPDTGSSTTADTAGSVDTGGRDSGTADTAGAGSIDTAGADTGGGSGTVTTPVTK